jgi:hypothetical protein
MALANPSTALPVAEAWRDGALLVMKDGGTAPKRCVKCNAPAHEPPVPVKLAMNRNSIGNVDSMGGVGAAVRLADAVDAAATIRRATVNVYVCELHRPKKRNMVLACIIIGVGIVAAIICMVLTLRSEHSVEYSAGACVAILISMIAGGLLVKLLVRPERIDGELAWMKGAGEAFLQSLELWTGG